MTAGQYRYEEGKYGPERPDRKPECLLKAVIGSKLFPKDRLWVSYDEEGDVLYVNFQKPSRATGSEITDDDHHPAVQQRRCGKHYDTARQRALGPLGSHVMS